MLNSSIQPQNSILSNVTTPSQSGPVSNGNEIVLHIAKHSSIEASPSDSLIPIYGNAVGLFYSPSRFGRHNMIHL